MITERFFEIATAGGKAKVKALPRRSQVKEADRWDLESLFPSDEAWEKAFAAWEPRIA